MFSFFDLLGGFRDALGVFTGERLAALAMILLVVFMVATWINLKTRLALPSADWLPEKVAEERVRYLNWRDDLATGGQIPQLYNRLLQGALNWLSRFLKDDDRQPQYWSGPALDRCLLLALIYPIITLISVWHLTGQTGPVETALQLEPDTTGAQRGFSAFSIIIFYGSYIWLHTPPSIHQTGMWRIIRWLAAISASVSVAILVIATANVIAGAIIIALGYAFTVSFAVSRAGARESVGTAGVAFAVAFSVTIAFGTVGGLVGIIGLVFGAALLVAFTRAAYAMNLASWTFFNFVAIYLGLIAGLIRYWDVVPGVGQAPEWLLLVFLGVLPLLNALFDWLSIGFTRWLLNTGLRKGGWWGLAFAMVDLIVAALALFALMIVTIGFLEWLNALSAAGGGNPVLDIRGLIETLKTDPDNPSVWWIYVTIFTTFIPSLVNLVLGGLSVIRGLPGLTPWVSRQILTTDIASISEFRRWAAAAWLSLQLVIAIAAALLIGLAIMFYFLDLMSALGFGLVTVADTVYTAIGTTTP
ncbi:MAG: hypothetical protein AAGG45_00475 [Pseudomonadota bacterium]